MLPGWADYLRLAPEALTSVVNLADPAAGGQLAPVEVLVAFDGDDAQAAAAAIDPIRRLGTVIEDDVAPRHYADVLAEVLRIRRRVRTLQSVAASSKPKPCQRY